MDKLQRFMQSLSEVCLTACGRYRGKPAGSQPTPNLPQAVEKKQVSVACQQCH